MARRVALVFHRRSSGHVGKELGPGHRTQSALEPDRGWLQRPKEVRCSARRLSSDHVCRTLPDKPL